MRELRHDFRAYYGVSYDDVPTDEAIDLIFTLPAGSSYLGALDPHLIWSDQQNALASIEDSIWKLIQLYATGSTKDAIRVPRPWDATERVKAARKSKKAREILENTSWKDVDHG